MFKKIALGVIGVFVVLMIIAVNAPTPTNKNGDASQQEAAAPQVAPTEVTSVELGKAFEANEVAAKAKFGDKTLKVTGTIQSVELDFADDPVIQLKGANDFTFVSINLDKSQAEQTSTMSKGQKITVTCNSLTEVVGFPQLDDCTL